MEPLPPIPDSPSSNRNCLTLEKRAEAVRLLNSGQSIRKVCKIMGCGRTQIHDISKRKRETMEEYAKSPNVKAKRRCRDTGFEEINRLTWIWFQDSTGRRFNISGPLIQERALIFAHELGISTFKASNGWLESFLKRHDIVFKKLTGERGDVDLDVVSSWKSKLHTKTAEYKPADIFNMDETGLFFKDTTKSSYLVKGEDCGGGKKSKERITIALCASMEGKRSADLYIALFCLEGIPKAPYDVTPSSIVRLFFLLQVQHV